MDNVLRKFNFPLAGFVTFILLVKVKIRNFELSFSLSLSLSVHSSAYFGGETAKRLLGKSFFLKKYNVQRLKR